MHVHVHVKLMLAFVILRVYTHLGENFARLGAYNILDHSCNKYCNLIGY